MSINNNDNFDQNQNPNPKLFPCPDCGNLVSYSAISCPKCGRNFSVVQQTAKPTTEQIKYVPVPQSSGMGFWGIVFAIIVGLLIFSIG